LYIGLLQKYFLDNPENKPTVNHKNGKRQDNRSINLEWATQQENVLHSFRVNGRKCSQGESNPKAKISQQDAIQIRSLKRSGVSSSTIAQMYSITQTQVCNIVKYRCWPITSPELIEQLQQAATGNDLISFTISLGIQNKASHLEIIDYIKSQSRDNKAMMAGVIGETLTTKIMQL